MINSMTTYYAGSEAERRALDGYIKLSRASEAVSTAINGYLKEYDLTISQFGVLEAIYHLGPLHQKHLAQKILKSDGNLTLVIDNLVKQALVERVRDIVDRRCVYVHLTTRGRELISTLFPAHVQRVLTTMNILTPEEQDQLAVLCRKLGLGVGL
jgi:MarR family 2-MHQ and catechol resistance regulon transcriptional repressor